MKKVLLFSTISLGLVSICTAVRYYDYRHQSVSEIIELYNQREEQALTEPENVKALWGDAEILISALEKKGGEEFLPFFMEKSLSTNLPEVVRDRSARAYVKIADLDESVNFVRHLYLINTNKTGHWRYALNKQLIEKFESEKQKSEINPVIKSNYFSFLIEQIINPGSATQANQIDQYLLATLPGYTNSKQRTVIANIFANSGNEWRTNTFNPIKAHFDALPKSELVDLREQFPDLPPLPSEEEGGVRWVYGVGGLMLVVVCLAVGFRYFRCKNNKG